MAQEKIIIKFNAQGDKALIHAIKQLHASQVLLEKGSKEYRVFVFKSCGTSAFSQRFLRVTHEKGLVAIHSCDSIDQNNP